MNLHEQFKISNLDLEFSTISWSSFCDITNTVNTFQKTRKLVAKLPVTCEANQLTKLIRSLYATLTPMFDLRQCCWLLPWPSNAAVLIRSVVSLSLSVCMRLSVCPCVCLRVCLVCLVISETFTQKLSFLLCGSIFRISRSCSYVKVIGSRSRSQKQKVDRGA